jgi:hypothetical protein
MTNLDEVNFPFEILGQALNNGMYYVRSCIGEGSFGRTFLVDDTFSSTRFVSANQYADQNALKQLI